MQSRRHRLASQTVRGDRLSGSGQDRPDLRLPSAVDGAWQLAHPTQYGFVQKTPDNHLEVSSCGVQSRRRV